jgi:hypothetical protein
MTQQEGGGGATRSTRTPTSCTEEWQLGVGKSRQSCGTGWRTQEDGRSIYLLLCFVWPPVTVSRGQKHLVQYEGGERTWAQQTLRRGRQAGSLLELVPGVETLESM